MALDDLWEQTIGFSVADHDREDRNPTDAAHPLDSARSDFDSRLYTFDWSRGRILELHTTEGVVEITAVLDVGALIPSSDRASGGFRGFHIGTNGIYITSIVTGADEKSRIHFLTYPPVE